MIINNGIALEGGALRGLFTSGVLDVLMESDMYFEYTIGVSAGALNGINYVSRQPGRSAEINLEYINDRHYMGMRPMLTEHRFFSFNFMFGEAARKKPFDYKQFNTNEQRLVAVATNCLSGQATYFEKGKCKNIFSASAASASMPMLSSKIMLDNEPYLDGGVAMPIPLARAMEDGYSRPVLVLTRERGFRKPQADRKAIMLWRRRYGKYPHLLAAMCNMSATYNTILERVEALEDEGRIFVLRPQEPVTVGMERNVTKLADLYWSGRAVCRDAMPALERFLKNE